MDQEIDRVIKQYKQRLEASGIRVKKIILYGSHAQGEAKEDSDIDLVVISEDFKDMDLWERLSLLGYARIGIRKPMEILGFTEEEFAEKEKGTFVGDEIKAKGVEILFVE